MIKQRYSAVFTGLSLSIAILSASSFVAAESLAAGAKQPAGEIGSMPSAAPSYKNPNSKNSAQRSGVNSDNAGASNVGHSTMTVRMKSPVLQGTAGSAGNSPFLEGNVQRVNSPDDPFAAAGMAQTDAMQKKPKPAKIEADAYRAFVSKSHPQFAMSLATNDPIEVIEVKGQWDKADRTLNNLGIPHTVIPARQLDSVGLARARVLVINCDGNIGRPSLQGIRDFVTRGGYLLTTDWALNNMLKQTFPGYVEWNKGKSRGNVVDAHVVAPEREFFQGTVTNASWKLDDESQTIRVLKPDTVKVLAISRDLAPLDPDGKGILAVVFPFGKGKVMHLVGHFDNNSLPLFPRQLPDPAPMIGIGLRQAMAANFILSALERGR